MKQDGNVMKKSKIPGIAMIVIGILIFITGVIMYSAKNGEFGINVEDIIGALISIAIGVIMLFVYIKKYGWLIGALLFVAVTISKITEGKFDGSFYVSIVFAVVCVIMLVVANVKQHI